MTARERAALYESAGLPLCLWTPETLRYVQATVRPPPPTRPRWVKSDAEFQAKCLATIQGLRARGKTILFVSHSPEAVTAVCDRVCVLDEGELRFDGSVGEGLAFYDGLRQSAERIVRPRR